MKLRIRAGKTGSITKGTWSRIYIVEAKSFLFWSELKRFEFFEDADKFMDTFGRPRAVILEF